ncbi:unnamed protein product [Clonostachys byssicola]|uniref:Nephrocystin 3-like N-terminal domain-containing protein n=1 Tax=Clonostachys byssicola TaxID=160290 RepID=A0A9N9U3A3_9HYPO|nr:unnamed protein product [Clonostachys byssicola]
MASSGAPKVYRATNLPHHVDRLAAAELLTQCIPGTTLEDVQIESLAPVVDPWVSEPTKVATLRFKSAPVALTQGPGRMEWSFPILGSLRSITLDIHFYGLTPLNEVNENSHTDDCIVISGLASHPMGSWQPRGDKGFMWIRDALPSRFPGVRFIIYGYDTALSGSKSFQVVPDIAGSLISELKANGWAAPAAKPIIFLAHSLGGVVLKQSMVMLAGSGVRERQIIRNIKGAIFFGVPTVGMAVPDIYEMLGDQPNTALLDYLSDRSNYIPTLEKQFDGISYTRDMVLFWAYETQATPSLSNSSGGWKRSGPDTVMVSPESATGGRHGISPERLLQIDADHSNMVKFKPGDRLIPIMADKIREIIDNTMIYASSKRPNRVISETPANRSKRPDSNMFTGNGKMKASKILTTDITWFSQVLRKSLLAPERDLRLYTIDENTKNTFGWVYDHPDINLSSWLLKGEGIFWLSGKPGSGKSTMMKFIWNDPRTYELLHPWGSKHQQILINFFFHHRGSAIQKSFEGLIQSILFQIISKEPQLCTLLEGIVEKTFPEHIAAWRESIDRAESKELRAKIKEARAKMKAARAKLKEDRPDLEDDVELEDGELELPARLWTRRALEESLYALLLQDKIDLDLFLLLDALDEYDGRPEFIADFLKRMIGASSRTRVRVLFSSRPWKVFQDEFESCPGFKIHEHTEDDIRKYAVESVPPGAEVLFGLTEKIVQRSQGVFLWVKLVMRQLSSVVAEPFQENADGQGLSFRLEMKLKELPDQLDDFYYTIVERIPDVFRWDTYVLLECMVRSRNNLNVEEALSILNLSKEATSVDWGKYLDGNKHLSKKELAKGIHQLKAISGGLLEISEPNKKTFYAMVNWYNEPDSVGGTIQRGDSFLPIIQFMHQTVQEFVQEPGFRHAILGVRGRTTNGNGHSFMTEYLFHQSVFPGARKSTAFHGTEDEKMEHLLPLFFHAREAEKTTGTGQAFLVRDRIILQDWTPLKFCVAAGLRLLLRQILQQHADAVVKCKGGLLPTIMLSLKKRYLEPTDAIQMIVDIVEHGYRMEKDLDTMHELFVKIWKYRLSNLTGASDESVCSRRDYIAITTEALKGFTGETILFRKRDNKFSLIHRCPPELMRQLLALGVNPNSSFDHASGHSVLDSFILTISPIDTVFIDSAIYDAFRALIEHGAVLHTTKRRIWEYLTLKFVGCGYDMSFLPEYPTLKSSNLRSLIAETIPPSNSVPAMTAEQGKGVAQPGRSRFSEKLKRLSTSFQMSTFKRGDKEKKVKAPVAGTGSETTSLA